MDIKNFPAPRIPLSPVLGDEILITAGQPTPSTIYDAAHQLNTTSGRAALSIALEKCGVTNQHEVLIPSYHCESMISPALRLNAKVVFYKINGDTSPSISDIKQKITSKTKAIIVTHFFGFTENLHDIRKICDEKSIFLIEDCAHAFFGNIGGESVGSIGDYAIASTMKFFPVFDGGILASNKHDLSDVYLQKPSISFQLKSWINSVERALAYKRLGSKGQLLNFLLTIKTQCWRFIKSFKSQDNQVSIAPSSSEGGFGLDENWIHVKSTIFSSHIIKRANFSSISQTRRSNYKQLHDALRTLPSCEPLFNELPQGITPLVYPLKFHNPERYFVTLKEKGVPIWRFGEYLDNSITEDDFPISCELSRTIFQLPCHQSLAQQELDWMITTIKDTVKA